MVENIFLFVFREGERSREIVVFRSNEVRRRMKVIVDIYLAFGVRSYLRRVCVEFYIYLFKVCFV